MASPSASDLARAREVGVCAVLGPRWLSGLAFSGPDAASFLHSQLTNEVEKLEPGDGNLQARVTRTGHLVALLSLHRRLDGSFVGLTDAPEALTKALDDFLFADQVDIRPLERTWLAVQGPQAAAVCESVFGAVGFEPWDTLPDYAIRPLTRARGHDVPEGALVVRRSFTGDKGFVLGLPATALRDAVVVAATEAGMLVPDDVDGVFEVLRIEAGQVELARDTTKPRLLPETGLERHAVSYSKGCYLGQEVIARVRTYGSVPNGLRALVLDAATSLEAGSDLVENGKAIGQLSTAVAWSPVAEAPVALAWLDRKHRTPGTKVAVDGVTGTVAVLPLYEVPDQQARVAWLYDRAVRAYADGREDTAIDLLGNALQLDPSHHDSYEVLGVILGKAGRFHEAIDFFKRLEEIAPDEPMVNTNLSVFYMKLGDKTTAEDHAGKAVEKQLVKRSGRGGKTAADVAKQQQENRRRDAERKRNMFLQVLEFDPVDPIALFGLGTALSTLESWGEAAEYLQQASEVDKNNSAVWLARGKALEALEQPAEALTVYERGMEVASKRGDLMPLREMEHRVLLLQAQT